jgi:hypothetical protein
MELRRHTNRGKMRPIVSNVDAASEKIAKWFVEEFNTFTAPTGLYVKNTPAALEKLEGATIKDEECMLPIDVALTLFKKWLRLHVSNMNTINAYLELAKLCMDQTYFQINGRFSKQNFGQSIHDRF